MTPSPQGGTGGAGDRDRRAAAIVAALAARGLELPAAPSPVAAYAPWARTGSLVFTSGQLPLVGGALATTGAVGEGRGDVAPADARELAATAALNALAVLSAAVAPDARGDDRAAALAGLRVVKLTGFVASVPAFTGQPGVVDGASVLLRELLGENGLHARSAVGVAALPLGAPVEVELVAEVLRAGPTA